MKIREKAKAVVFSFWGPRGQGMSASGVMAAFEGYLSPEINRRILRISPKVGRLK